MQKLIICALAAFHVSATKLQAKAAEPVDPSRPVCTYDPDFEAYVIGMDYIGDVFDMYEDSNKLDDVAPCIKWIDIHDKVLDLARNTCEAYFCDDADSKLIHEILNKCTKRQNDIALLNY